jgi:hypothetical protein
MRPTLEILIAVALTGAVLLVAVLRLGPVSRKAEVRTAEI